LGRAPAPPLVIRPRPGAQQSWVKLISRGRQLEGLERASHFELWPRVLASGVGTDQILVPAATIHPSAQALC